LVIFDKSSKDEGSEALVAKGKEVGLNVYFFE
jgi:hypothetical protein